MRISVRELKRRILRELFVEGRKNAPYDNLIIDDPAFNSTSTYVNDDVKDAIRGWVKSMFSTDRRDERSMSAKDDS